ncbi:LysM peptidoglycan-binding domain-containing protein [Microbacterium sp. NPDC078428]|uniref:LysM peptidoglycan-binding domain-containing protein n=1 Tax=Microbacterium limosum TaxID=3079935 RepID=A0AAU0MIB4_9MICO|nr:LysM peptidoglycan-binding domain-containing protein [Microbacterium sp. Y20]WOQ70338.1 LysM peptidoglycan-binding domain-containing protein [Microbacterium sp. Y20]
MTTATITTGSLGAPTMGVAPRTRLRLTDRGRRVVAGLLAGPVAAAILFGSLAAGEALASRETTASAGSFETVTVEPGQSLWAIAADVAPSADPRDVVDEIVRLNALESSTVRAGQQIAIPTSYAP